MSKVDITTIDLTDYQTAPVLSTEGTLTLAVDLDKAKPANAPAHVEKAGKRMVSTAELIRQEFVARVGIAGLDPSVQVAYDIAVDRFWNACRQRCYFWMAYDHQGLDLLSEAEQEEIDLEDKRQKAELARELDRHLFGSEGLSFVRKPYSQQVVQMASRLTFIKTSEKYPAYEEVIGSELLTTLNVLQGRYEDMVHGRAIRDDGNANLRHLRATLQRHISLYANAVLTMLDEDDPESVEIVLDALRPIVNARTHRPRSYGSGDQGDAAASEELAEALAGDEPPQPSPASEELDSN